MTDVDIEAHVCTVMGADSARLGERIQALWSGYGEIRRVHLRGADVESVVVKVVQPPVQREKVRHARGWNTDRSHQRKLRSYDVERAFYRGPAARCTAESRVPVAHDCSGGAQRWVFVLEDLDASGFALRRFDPDAAEVHACLVWLAHFHATFLGASPEGLWEQGTYWHLATRPDELSAMNDARLRDAAAALDARLLGAQHRTLVHGDAKAANFCFADDGGRVAAVDFQYVGGGCGMQDVAYFLSSCLDEDGCDARADGCLDDYFASLRSALDDRMTAPELDALESEWRALYPVAWADFYRFLAGWAPDHHKIHGYSRRMTEQALAELDR